MKVRLLVLAILAVGLLTAARGTGTPSATWTSAPGYTLAFSGSGWPANDLVVFHLSQSTVISGLELRATASGSFEVGINNFSCSGGGVGRLQDLQGNRVTLPILDPCGSGPVSTPTYSALVGRYVKEKVTRLAGMGAGKTVSIGLGDALYLWEAGKKHASVLPSAPAGHFFQIGYGYAARPGCHGQSCEQGFFWEWVGITSGPDITLRPWCGTGPCPELWVAAIRVWIRPAGRNM